MEVAKIHTCVPSTDRGGRRGLDGFCGRPAHPMRRQVNENPSLDHLKSVARSGATLHAVLRNATRQVIDRFAAMLVSSWRRRSGGCAALWQASAAQPRVSLRQIMAAEDVTCQYAGQFGAYSTARTSYHETLRVAMSSAVDWLPRFATLDDSS
jgi:hypothetical protein